MNSASDTLAGLEPCSSENVAQKACPSIFLTFVHIEYENRPSGLKVLAERMREYFDWVDANPDKPDNRFLELALFTHYEFPSSAQAQRLVLNCVN